MADNSLSLYTIHQKVKDNPKTIFSDTPPTVENLWWDTGTNQLRRHVEGEGWKAVSNIHHTNDSNNSAPQDTAQIWVDNNDDNVEVTLGTLESEIRATISSIQTKVDTMDYAFTQELNPGYFKGVIPGSDPDAPVDPDAPDLPDGAAGNVGRIRVKRGLKADIGDLLEGEFGFCIDTEELYIGNGSKGLRLMAKAGGLGGSNGGNVTSEYIELISASGKKYRLTVNDIGEPMIYDSDAEDAIAPALTDGPKFSKLLINKVYGGGDAVANTTPVSHSFIELYNSSEVEINLKGLSLQYAGYMENWQVLPLRGTVKPFSSFLIRCKQHSDPYRISTRFKVLDFDMSWDIPISDKGYKVYLTVGTDASTFQNPANTDSAWTHATGFINLFAVGGEDAVRLIDGYEKSFLHLANVNRMCKRKYSEDVNYVFSNTGKDGTAPDNGYDIDYVDMRYADVELYTPRSTKYGQWNYFYNQVPLDLTAPNVLNVGFGYDGNTSRTFTWQSQVTDKGYLKYRKKEDTQWITVSSTKKFVAHSDVDVTIHSAIIKDLTPGSTYVYKAGWEGHWGDEYELFIPNAADFNSPISFIQISDQQSWDIVEYSAWQKANDFIEKNESYDFIINTGDISQNGNRSFEWRNYYDVAKHNLSSHVQMSCVGNNDLVDKKDSIAYTYYSTVENYNSGTYYAAPYPSVYSFNYGYIHFLCLDSNIIASYRGVDEQVAFIAQDMAQSQNQKRWRIAYMHESPYTIIRNTKTTKLINALYNAGYDLVLCGHHHCYTRSYRMGTYNSTTQTDTVNDPNGVYYIMSQATGYKLSGKTAPASDAAAVWRAAYQKIAQPCYIKFDVTYDKIEMDAYRLDGIMPLIDNVNSTVTRYFLEPGQMEGTKTLTILPRSTRPDER